MFIWFNFQFNFVSNLRLGAVLIKASIIHQYTNLQNTLLLHCCYMILNSSISNSFRCNLLFWRLSSCVTFPDLLYLCFDVSASLSRSNLAPHGAIPSSASRYSGGASSRLESRNSAADTIDIHSVNHVNPIMYRGYYPMAPAGFMMTPTRYHRLDSVFVDDGRREDAMVFDLM